MASPYALINITAAIIFVIYPFYISADTKLTVVSCNKDFAKLRISVCKSYAPHKIFRDPNYVQIGAYAEGGYRNDALAVEPYFMPIDVSELLDSDKCFHGLHEVKFAGHTAGMPIKKIKARAYDSYNSAKNELSGLVGSSDWVDCATKKHGEF